MERNIWMIRIGAAAVLIAFFLPLFKLVNGIFGAISFLDIAKFAQAFYIIPVAMLVILATSFLVDPRKNKKEFQMIIGISFGLTVLVIVFSVMKIQKDIQTLGTMAGGLFGGLLGGSLGTPDLALLGLPAGVSLGSLAGQILNEIITPTIGVYLSVLGYLAILTGWIMQFNTTSSQRTSSYSKDLISIPAKVSDGPYLEVIRGALPQKSIPISTAQFSIGRSSKNNLQLPDNSVSRVHANLKFAQGMWFLQDQNSSGGTFVNSQPINALRLNPGDQIRIGNHTFIFRG